jgi:hypothetical protein
MMNAHMVLAWVSAVIFFCFTVYAGWIFIRYRTKYNLAVWVLLTALCLVSLADLFLPGEQIMMRVADYLGLTSSARVFFVIALPIVLLLIYFYPNLNKYPFFPKDKI